MSLEGAIYIPAPEHINRMYEYDKRVLLIIF